MKIVIIGGGPCGLGAAWRTEEIRRQGEIFRIKILKKKKKSFFSR
jgi:protoporphyrinogen oxidase